MAGGSTTTSVRVAADGLSTASGSFGYRRIEQVQRARLLAAMAQAATAQGAANATVADVVTRAGVSRRTFYEIFADYEDCLLATLEDAVARAGARVLPAYELERGGWRKRIRAGLLALLVFLEEQPSIARLLIVEWLAAGPRALDRRQQLLSRLAGAVDEGRSARPDGNPTLPELNAEGIVGGVASLLHSRLLSPQPDNRLVELGNPLMAMIVAPYLGAAAARRELEQALPQSDVNGSHEAPSEDPLQGLQIRVTYRTMRVLAAIAANPGGSNRTIARAAGIGDQGQISKLLMRLRKLGLAEIRRTPAKGEPNAWILSAKGAQVERLLRPVGGD